MGLFPFRQVNKDLERHPEQYIEPGMSFELVTGVGGNGVGFPQCHKRYRCAETMSGESIAPHLQQKNWNEDMRCGYCSVTATWVIG
eukprot:jgi/Botrbrau1/5943/Bobra.0366s0113.1